MSKTELKKHLQSLTKEQVIEQVLELYGNCKPAKEYFGYLLNPDEKGQFKKFKAIIINEFYPKGNRFNPSLRFSVAKKAIADFRSLKPSHELLADLLVTTARNSLSIYKRVRRYVGTILQQYRHQFRNCVEVPSTERPAT